MERTFAIIKPDATATKHAGNIISIIELNGFNIIGMQKKQLTRAEAETFYAVHKERPFFGELVNYMISGPVIVMALEKENAIQEWRDLMGATNPAKAAPGTLRRMFGTSIGSNATHGSDAPETAKEELKFFFPNL
jgi:nucleoside-diphosphate kinase